MERVEDALADFELQLRADGRSEHTVKQYGRHVRLLARWMKATSRGDDLAALDHRAVAEFMTSDDALRRPDGEPKMAMSVNALRSSLRCFFAYLHDSGILDRNPARLLKRSRCGPPPPRAIADEDLRRMFQAMEADGSSVAKRDLALFRFVAATGVRLGSVVALRVEDLDSERGACSVRETKGRAPYEVGVPAAEVTRVRAFIGDRTAGPLFPSSSGSPLSCRQVQQRLGVWAKRAGVSGRVHVHGLRHRLAMQVYEDTRDLLAVARRLGHRSISASAVYLRAALT